MNVVATSRSVSATGDDELTDAQRAFAHIHRATPGLRSEVGDAVFLYERGARRTNRWLVSNAGRVLDSASFRNH